MIREQGARGVRRTFQPAGLPLQAEALRRRLSALPSIASDTLLTLLAAAFSVANFVVGDRGPGGITGWAVPLALACAAALVLRSRWPLFTLFAVGATSALYLLVTGRPTFAILPSVFIALYSAVAYSRQPRRFVWLSALGVCITLSAVNLLSHGRQDGRGDRPPGPPPTSAGWGVDRNLPENVSHLLLDGGWMLTALVLGETMRGRRAFAHEAELRAEQAERAQQEAERAQHETAQRRVAEERLQIARELHDVLAHTVALINVQAGVAAHVIDLQPDKAREALTTIKEASRATLQELRAMVGVLRESDGSAPRSPATGLAALEGLVNSASAGGLTVDLHVERPNTPLPVTVDLAAYRIVQEALTNVIKHAGPVAVSVRVIQHGPHLEIEVRNAPGRTATPAPASGSGHGLLGMRERAAALGGTLKAGPLTDGGFRVHALLPAPVEG